MKKLTLKAARVNSGMTMREAASKLGVSYATFQKRESSPEDVTLKGICEMCKLYGIKFKDLDLSKIIK